MTQNTLNVSQSSEQTSALSKEGVCLHPEVLENPVTQFERAVPLMQISEPSFQVRNTYFQFDHLED